MKIIIDKEDTIELLDAIFGLAYDTDNRPLMKSVETVREYVENENGEMDKVNQAEKKNGNGNEFIIE